ncbi:hypothetical protein [Pandoraea sp. NPDC087047]|uniref:hypothetical protein n=1 Tax=Pandoraea sp. NPDC087047 TaxID=3364390 RepID=UPI003822FA0F
MTLNELLAIAPSSTHRPQDIRLTLVDAQTAAGRELRDACESASSNGTLFLDMVTLLTLPEEERTLDRLTDAGIFLAPGRARHLRSEDAALLRSNEGLQLWLRYAAEPAAYMDLFDGTDVFGPAFADDQTRIDKILRVLVACGRDRTDATPSYPADSAPYNPLSHLCSQIAPQWLRRVLELGTDPNQASQTGTPLAAAAMRAEAMRLHNAGKDPLLVHDSLRQLAELLKRHGSNLMQPNRRGVPAVALLTLHGLCGAAEALLAAGADPNAADTSGNTLMHYLAHAIHERNDPRRHDTAQLAHYTLIAASRYGGDLSLVNRLGHAARDWIPALMPLSPMISDSLAHIARETALRRIKALS